ncbi:MAG: 1-deoxy-D-xylulose-5-phosphate synthase [Phycisphaerales bacterium JB050]
MTILPTIASPADLKALKIDQLPTLAQEIRDTIISKVTQSGGHLAPNLGVVELTIALHYVFDFGHDRLLFDVGHQCYPHKLLTGRLNMISGLRTRDGMAGFPEPKESSYDLFSVGHAGTAISTAVGMARGDSLNGEAFDPQKNAKGRRIVSLIGDASIVNGVAMEGLNNAGTLNRQFLIVLNDNGMSISKPQGALAAYFDRMRINPLYGGMKRRAKRVLRHMPGGSRVAEAYHRMTEAMKAGVAEHSWFENFGLLTVGPVDGHDLPSMIEFLSEIRDFDRPMVLHVKTIKGKGLDYAEKDATTFHSPAAHTYDPKSCRVEIVSKGRSFTAAFAEGLTRVMEADEKVVSCTAAMPGGTGLDKVAAEFPDRTFDVGICESHAMDMMAGMAKTGLKPFFAVYSTFLQRAFDQAFQEVALQGLPVRLCLDRAGLVGGDGAVHHGFCDVAILSALPDAVLMAAMDEQSLNLALDFMADWDSGLSCVRYPRDSVSDRFVTPDCPPFELGKARPLITHDEPDIALLGFGVMALNAAEASERLKPEIRADVYDARFAKPVDEALLTELLNAGVPVVTIEDHSVKGGFGTQVLEACNRLGLDTRLVTRLALPDGWIYQNSRNQQLEEAGLDAASIAASVREVLAGHPASPSQQVETRPVEPRVQS